MGTVISIAYNQKKKEEEEEEEEEHKLWIFTLKHCRILKNDSTFIFL